MSPSRYSPPTDRPRYPEIAEKEGEDPARFLSSSEHYLPEARIKGIHSKALLSAYRAVEIKSYGGRDIILDEIAKRERELELEGSGDE